MTEKDKSEQIALVAKMVLDTIDSVGDFLDIEHAEKCIEKLHSNASTAMAGSIIWGTDKADDAHDRATVYEAFVNLVKARKKQRDNLIKRYDEKQTREMAAEMFGVIL